MGISLTDSKTWEYGKVLNKIVLPCFRGVLLTVCVVVLLGAPVLLVRVFAMFEKLRVGDIGIPLYLHSF